MIDLRDLPIGRFCNYVWYMLTRGGEQREVEKIRATLWQPPEGLTPHERSPWSAENELKSFKTLQAQLTGAA